MKYKNFICVVVNCIVFLVMSIALEESYPYDYFWELGTIIISFVFSIIGRKNIKGKLVDFIKTFIVSYLCIVVIISIDFIYSMRDFEMPPIFPHLNE